MPKDAPLTVELPEAGRDRPGFLKVSVIAAVGFVLGIAWPRVMGVRLGIAAPGESSAAASASAGSNHGGRAPEPNAASIVAKGPAAAAPAASLGAAPTEKVAVPVVAASAAPAPSALSISVHKGSVLSCKTSDGDTKKGKECGSISAIDQFISPRLRKLGTCAGMDGQTGKLSVVVGADFGANRYSYDVGKSSTVANPEAVATCLQTMFKNNSLAGTAHDYPRYTIAYTAQLSTGADGEKAEPETRALAAQTGAKEASGERGERGERDERDEKTDRAELASGEAKVSWEVALVRDLPKTGNLVTRLPRGAKVKVGGTKDGWYQIKFGDGFANDGWVYRGAIGR